ncbi:MAG: cofactor-independent phosphoglycerate mutase [Thermodesulfovibrionales bacterium]|nr:cofactor-independent phosphoglycerate mutase [Thermodesulfovibrionales bacterium]
MKYIIIVPDGMADRPLKELGGKTPLMVAFTPNMDRLASEGIVGTVRTIPEGLYPGSDVANLSIMGYDPRKYYTGRAPLEAASIGVNLTEEDVAYRCNLVTLQFNKDKTRAIMDDYSAGHITTDEARELIRAINEVLSNDSISFYPGVSYRHLMVWKKGIGECDCTPPHDIIGKEITDYLPSGKADETLRSLMLRSVSILESHPVNRSRIQRGLKPANSIWLWGQGKRPKMPTFMEKYGIKGSLISAVDLTKGLGIYAGLRIINVPGATGYIDTNYAGKAEYGINSLRDNDLVYIHIEAPDEASHEGSIEKKIKAIEDIDALVIGTVLRMLKSFEEYRILILPDHATPISVRTHTEEPVPFILYDSRKRAGKQLKFDESLRDLKEIIRIDEGYKLMDYFIRDQL